MNGCLGIGRIPRIGCCTAGAPKTRAGGLEFGPSGIGIAAAAGAAQPAMAASAASAAPAPAERMWSTIRDPPPEGCCHAGPPVDALDTLNSMVRIDHTELLNGLPLVKLSMPGTRAVTALVAFDAGARTER